MKLDLHIHTAASVDGTLSPQRLLDAALAAGLSGLAVTDHNNGAYCAAVRAAAPADFTVIDGMEVSTDGGHMLALFVRADTLDKLSKTNGRYPLPLVAQAVREQDGLLIAAHPFAYPDPLPDAVLVLIDGIETTNSRDMARNPGNRDAAIAAAQRHGKFATGGSDAHIAREVGRCYTVIPDGADVKTALRQGQSQPDGNPGHAWWQALNKLKRVPWHKKPRQLVKLFYFMMKYR